MQRRNHAVEVTGNEQLRRIWKRIKPVALANLALALGIVVVFLYFLDLFKHGDMNFMNNGITKFFALVLGVLGIANGVDLILQKRKVQQLRAMLRKAKTAAPKKRPVRR